MITPRFYFATCQVGAEKVVKAEILNEFPHLKFAFSRPGFITFKEDDDQRPIIHQTHGVFTRLWGKSIGQAKDPSALIELIQGLADAVPEINKNTGKTHIKIHAFERDCHLPGDEPEDFVANEKIQNIKKTLYEALPENAKALFQWNFSPSLGERIFDLIWIDDFHVFLGSHIHGPHLDAAPGNMPKIHLPSHSPARSYLKIAEAIHRFKPKIEKGMHVLEIGCSPGGATTALLGLGLKVTGIDPKFMDQSLYSQPNFTFIQKTALTVTSEDLTSINPDWIVMDMNIAPLEALDELGHIIDCLRGIWKEKLKLKQGFLTIKLNDWSFSQSIPLYLKRLKEKGFYDLTATQLYSNKQEFFVIAKSFR